MYQMQQLQSNIVDYLCDSIQGIMILLWRMGLCKGKIFVIWGLWGGGMYRCSRGFSWGGQVGDRVGWMILIIMISERDYNNIYKGCLQFIHI